MNTNQKIAIFVATTILAILLVLHSPWTGCEISIWQIAPNDGFGGGGNYDLNFSDWHSHDPLVTWFGNLLNALATSAVSIGLAGLCCHLFRSPKSGESSIEQPNGVAANADLTTLGKSVSAETGVTKNQML